MGLGSDNAVGVFYVKKCSYAGLEQRGRDEGERACEAAIEQLPQVLSKLVASTPTELEGREVQHVREYSSERRGENVLPKLPSRSSSSVAVDLGSKK